MGDLQLGRLRPAPTPGGAGGGWVKIAGDFFYDEPYLGGPTIASSQWFNAPLGGQAIFPQIPLQIGFSIPADWDTLGYWIPSIYGNGRYAHNRSYLREYPTPGGSPLIWPEVFVPVPEVPAQPDWRYDPMGRPIDQPLGVPRPVPYRNIPRLNPRPDWPESRSSGPSPAEERWPFRTGPGRHPTPRDLGFAEPRTIPSSVPGVSVRVRPNPRPLSPPPAKPPGKDTKEKKTIMNVASGSFVGRVINAVTETKDVVDAIYDALPYSIRKKYRNNIPAQEKAKIIYANLGKVDMQKAIENLAWNQVEDFAYGKLGKAVGKANRRIGRPVGVQTGIAL